MNIKEMVEAQPSDHAGCADYFCRARARARAWPSAATPKHAAGALSNDPYREGADSQPVIAVTGDTRGWIF